MVDYKKKIKSFVRKNETRDPYTLAKTLNIEVKFKYLSPNSPRGIFKRILRNKYIVINMTRIIDKDDLKVVLAHELGHAVRHCSNGAFFLHDHTLYARGKFEKEADEFAAELLIDKNELDTIYLENYSIDQLACFYKVPIELIKYKFNI